MNITKKLNGNEMEIALEGRLDTMTAPQLEAELGSLDKAESLVLDCTKLDYISSAGLRVLLTFQQELEEKDKSMMLCHVNDIIRDVFDVTGFLDILTIE